MATITIEIPEERAEAFTATAARQGLSLPDWIFKVADREVPPTSRRRRLTLEERLAMCDPNAPISEEEREWMDAPAVGREVW